MRACGRACARVRACVNCVCVRLHSQALLESTVRWVLEDQADPSVLGVPHLHAVPLGPENTAGMFV